jgi:L-lactate dehydrogenase
VACVNIDKYSQSWKNTANPIPPVDYDECEKFVHTSGGDIIARKGATFYAVAIATTHICKCIFSGNDTALTVSSMMHGEYGIDDLCLSSISLVGREGIKAHVYAELTDEETAKLQKSAECLREVLKGIQF